MFNTAEPRVDCDNRYADRLGINGITLVPLQSGFDADWAWQILEGCQHVAPLELAAKGCVTLRVDVVNLKRLRNIKTRGP